MKLNVDYTLYLCTDRSLMSAKTIEESVEYAIQGGCTIVQLREKEADSKEFFELAVRVKEVTNHYHIPLIINDRIDIALAINAAGVHVGQSDIPAKEVRRIIGNEKIMGVSTATVAEAKKAVLDGADYIGVGAMYTTSTKKNTRAVTMEELIRIRQAVAIPIVVIGGINANTINNFQGIGINGAAVVSAIVAQDNMKEAAKELKNMLKLL